MKKKHAALILGASWLALAGGALAQGSPATAGAEDPRDARIRALEERLGQLELELEDVQQSRAADSTDIRRIISDAPQVGLNNGRPTIATADGAYRFALRGIFQYDVASYNQDDNLPAAVVTAGFGDLGSGANFRRARIGVEGTVNRDWNYALTYEAGGSGVEAAGLQQAWLEYAGWRPWGLTSPVRFRLGAFAVENTLEGATSNAEQLFLERPSVAELVRGTFGGDGRSAFGIYANGDRLNVSAVLTGSLIGNTDIGATTSQFDEQTGFVARVNGLLLRGENSGLHVGANFSTILQSADAGGAGANNINLRERPELRVDDSAANNGGSIRLVETGNISANSATAYGLELGYQYRNFFVAGEYLNIEVDRNGTNPDPDFNGWYVQGAWTLTGEAHRWNNINGGFAGVRPTNAFDPTNDHWGAWEIAARYSLLDLNWRPGTAGGPPPTGGIRGGEQEIVTVGLNWYPTNTLRFLLDYQFVDINRIQTAAGSPSNANISQDYQAVALRSQFSF